MLLSASIVLIGIYASAVCSGAAKRDTAVASRYPSVVVLFRSSSSCKQSQCDKPYNVVQEQCYNRCQHASTTVDLCSKVHICCSHT